MSRTGRWRQWKSGFRTVGLGVLIAVLGWGGWKATAVWRENSRAMPAVTKAVPIRPPELVTSRGGVLDHAWLERTVELPRNVSLMEVDLDKLRDRVLSDGQVLTATVTRHFPDRLVVKISERTPALRIRVEFGGEPRELLVAQDGVVFAGSGFDRPLLDTLPWLGGVSLGRNGAWFRPIPEMRLIAGWLAQVHNEAPHLYEQCHVVSVARLAYDRELDVTLKNGTTVIFSTQASLITQLARLDAILDRLAHAPSARARIDLSLGREVPVMIEPLVKPDARSAAAGPGATPMISLTSSSKTKREL